MNAEARSPKSEGNPQADVRKVWVCFAVREEARAFERVAGGRDDVKVILVGVGKRNAERAIRAALAEDRPGLVLTCGFAGGLRGDLTKGTVVFAADPETGLVPALVAVGAKPARFHCAERLVATAEAKRALREATGADAVEMESEIICVVCREQRIPCAIVRVILDTAREDLPLDFSRLMTEAQEVSYGKLVLALAKSPGKLGGVLRLRKQAAAAAGKLAEVLAGVTAA